MENNYHLLLEPDFRYEGLEAMFEGYKNALQIFKNKYDENNWYDVDFYREETDLIYGVVLISLQNYINKWCADFLEAGLFGYTNAYQYYDRESKNVIDGITQVRLIVELANYFKHRDDNRKLQSHTSQTLEKVHLLQIAKNGNERYEDDLLIEGLLLITKNGIDIFELMRVVKKWYGDTLNAAKSRTSLLR